MTKHLSLLLFIGLAWGQNVNKEYVVPKGSRFNVSSLIRMDIQEIEKLLGKPFDSIEPTEYQEAVGMNISSNKMWRIETTGIDIEYNKYGIISIFIDDKEENLPAYKMAMRAGIDPTSKEYDIKYQKWISPSYAKKMKSSEIAGIRITPK